MARWASQRHDGKFWQLSYCVEGSVAIELRWLRGEFNSVQKWGSIRLHLIVISIELGTNNPQTWLGDRCLGHRINSCIVDLYCEFSIIFTKHEFSPVEQFCSYLTGLRKRLKHISSGASWRPKTNIYGKLGSREFTKYHFCIKYVSSFNAMLIFWLLYSILDMNDTIPIDLELNLTSMCCY